MKSSVRSCQVVINPTLADYLCEECGKSFGAHGWVTHEYSARRVCFSKWEPIENAQNAKTEINLMPQFPPDFRDFPNVEWDVPTRSVPMSELKKIRTHSKTFALPFDLLEKHCTVKREVRLQPMRVTLPFGLLIEDGEALSAEAPAGDLRRSSAFRLLKCPDVREGQYVKVSEILQDREVVVAYGIAQREEFLGMDVLKITVVTRK